MPTAEAFDQAALQLDSAADETQRLIGPIRAKAGPEVLAGSPLAQSVDRTIDDGRRDLRVITADLRELAREARQRAAETRRAEAEAADFVAQQERFELEQAEFEAGGEVGDPPVPPVAPPPKPAFADF